MADSNDALLNELRDEFNAQPYEERIRTGGFMTYEAVMELMRERAHAQTHVARLNARIDRLLRSEQERQTDRRSARAALTKAAPEQQEQSK